MRPTPKNKFILLLLALIVAAGMAHAQSTGPYIPLRVDITGYKGNTVQSDSISITPSDTLKTLTAVAMYREGNAPVPALAPTLIRKRLKVIVKWTLSPPFTDGWYQLLAGNQVIRTGAVHVTTGGVIVPSASGSVIASIIAQLAQSFGAGKLDVGTFNTFVSANTIALGLKLNLSDTTAFVRKYSGYRLMSTAEGVKLAGLPDGATYTATVGGINTAITLITPREFETFADAMAARATAPAVPQEWLVKHDETTLDKLGVPQRILYKWNGVKLYAPLLFEADGSPGTPSFNTAISDLTARAAAAEAGLTQTTQALAGKVDVTTYTQARQADQLANILALDSKPTYVTSIASLTAMIRGSVTSVIVSDFTRGGQFTYDASLTTFDYGITFPAYNGITISGGYRRVFSGSVSVLWWPVPADGISNDRPGVMACLDWITNSQLANINLIIPPRAYLFADYTSAGNILTLGSFSKSLGNVTISASGATLTTPLSSYSMTTMLTITGYIKSLVIDGGEIVNTHGLTANNTLAITLAGGSATALQSVTIRNLTFRNHSRTIQLQGVNYAEIYRNKFLYDNGHESGTTTSDPNVGIWAFCNANGTTGTVDVESNYWDGCIRNTVSTNTVSKLSMDGFIYGATLKWSVTGNKIKNHQYEAIYLGSTYPTTASVTGATYSAGVVTVTAPAHKLMSNGGTTGLAAGAKFSVTISGVTGMAEINGRFLATVLDANTFTIKLAAAPSTSYVSGGTVTDQYAESSAFISKNEIDSNPVDGISTNSSTSIRSDANQTEAVDNTVYGAVRGMLIQGVTTALRIKNVRATGNVINMASAPIISGFGIYVARTDGLTLERNEVRWGTVSATALEVTYPVGVFVANCTSGRLTKNRVSADVLATGAASGINIQQCSGFVLDDNETINMQYGLRCDNANTGLCKVRNHISTGDVIVTKDPSQFNFEKQTHRIVPFTGSGYYRIAQASNWFSGKITIQGYSGNYSTNQEWIVQTSKYGSTSDVTLVSNHIYTGGAPWVTRMRVGNGLVDAYIAGVPVGNTGVLTIMLESNLAEQVNGAQYLITSPPTNPTIQTGIVKELYTDGTAGFGTTTDAKFQGKTLLRASSGAGPPTTTQLPNDGDTVLWTDTSVTPNTTKWYTNQAGTIKAVAFN